MLEANPTEAEMGLKPGDKELTRVPLKQIDSENTESLSYGFTPAGRGALLAISWGKQAWTVELQAAD